jgi:transcription elongation factor GreA
MMQLPKRKPGKYTYLKTDPNLTPAKYAELEEKVRRLKAVSRPKAAAEVKRLAEMGDLSDNAAYSIAKGRLRGLNQRILELEDHLKRAVIIKPPDDMSVVRLGHQVTIETGGKERTYQILGSSETDPEHGAISNSSPLGSALMGKRVGDIVRIRPTLAKEISYRIIKIE